LIIIIPHPHPQDGFTCSYDWMNKWKCFHWHI
jgi:hypothetical protein